jgi:hypothetical protein
MTDENSARVNITRRQEKVSDLLADEGMLGQAAFLTYRACVHGIAVNGDIIPDWNDLREEIKLAWIISARNTRDNVLNVVEGEPPLWAKIITGFILGTVCITILCFVLWLCYEALAWMVRSL